MEGTRKQCVYFHPKIWMQTNEFHVNVILRWLSPVQSHQIKDLINANDGPLPMVIDSKFS